ncbi:MAG: hypothetical protein GY862_21675 [Gammaproteobacteria bacterium]|nr:hypothetical protein [Gammaproteobacteria bacterium]
MFFGNLQGSEAGFLSRPISFYYFFFFPFLSFGSAAAAGFGFVALVGADFNNGLSNSANNCFSRFSAVANCVFKYFTSSHAPASLPFS